MRLSKILFLLSALAIISSCTVSKQINELSSQGNTAFETGEYQKAFETYEEIIGLKTSRNKKIEPILYEKAGIAAWEVGETSKAIDYIEKSKQAGVVSSKAIYTLAKAYLKIDNLSREITNLEDYINKYPNGNELKDVQHQLFLAYVKSENWGLADSMWSKISNDDQTNSNARLLEGYLMLCNALKRSENLVPMAKNLLKVEPNNIIALEALAFEYYNLAENSYQSEMKAYQKNRTNKQYRQLLKALEVINSNFQISRDYFESLYKINPTSRYATYLGNIHTRFDNKKQANYYYSKAKQLD